ncbi:hypothetical protein L484_015367 [Morus notabilis]|uniref:Uncharacterized protein n=1 Tax=Morus notabilis TaxID=981085 RepID=W9RKA2_9ROSA|nr:hypothetical protein L484_015367 [Morus notabilis]
MGLRGCCVPSTVAAVPLPVPTQIVVYRAWRTPEMTETTLRKLHYSSTCPVAGARVKSKLYGIKFLKKK